MNNQTEIKPNCDVPTLWQEHKNELRNFIFKRVKNHALTDEILQEVLIKVYNFCISKSGVKNLRSWLFQIAQNTIIDFYRKQSKVTAKEDFVDVTEEDENLAFKEAVDYIKPMLAFLPEKYALPLKLSDIDNMKQSDIAKKLNLSLTATKSRIQRGRQLLKAEFVTCCHFETDATGNIISFDIKSSCTPLQKIKKQFSE